MADRVCKLQAGFMRRFASEKRESATYRMRYYKKYDLDLLSSRRLFWPVPSVRSEHIFNLVLKK